MPYNSIRQRNERCRIDQLKCPSTWQMIKIIWRRSGKSAANKSGTRRCQHCVSTKIESDGSICAPYISLRKTAAQRAQVSSARMAKPAKNAVLLRPFTTGSLVGLRRQPSRCYARWRTLYGNAVLEQWCADMKCAAVQPCQRQLQA